MIDFINIKAEKLEAFLREEGNEIFDFYILTDKYSLGKGHRCVNVYEMEALLPYMSDLKHDTVVEIKRSHKKYKQLLERKSIRGALSKVILDNILVERPMVFITSEEDKEFPWYLHVFEMLHDRYGIKVRSYSEYKRNKTPSIYDVMDDNTITNLTIDKFGYIDDAIGAADIMAVQDNPNRTQIPYDEPIYVKDANFDDVIDIGIRLNIFYDGGSEEEFRNRVMRAVIEAEKKQAPTKEQMMKMNLTTIYRIISQYKLDIPDVEEYRFEELVDKTAEMIEAINNNDTKYSIKELNSMSLRMLDKIAIMKGIDVRKLNKTTSELIMAICAKDGIEYDSSLIDTHSLISEDDIKYLSEDELMSIAVRMNIHVPSFVGKKDLVSLIERVSRFRYTSEKLSSYTRDELELLDKYDLATLLYNLDLYDSINDVFNNVQNKNQMINEIMDECSIKDEDDQKVHSLKELKNMSKDSLIKLAKKYNISATSLDRRSYIANQILKYYKKNKNKKHEKVRKMDYRDLLCYTTKELKSFCDKNNIEIESDMSKKELAKLITKIDYNIRRGRDVILNSDININDFNMENLLKEDKSDLSEFLEFNNVEVKENNPTKEQLAYHICEVLNPDSIKGYEFKGIDENTTEKKKDKKPKDYSERVIHDKSKILTRFSESHNEFDDMTKLLFKSDKKYKKQLDDISKVIIDDNGNRVLKTKKKSIFADTDFIKIDDDLTIEDGYTVNIKDFLNK